MADETGQTPTESPVTPESGVPTLLTEASEPPTEGAQAPEGTETKPEGEPATPEGEQKPESIVPEAYDLKVPEGMTFDTETFKTYEPLFKELKLNNDQAQKLVDLYAQQETNRVKAESERFQTQHTEWVSSVKTDAELGGKNFDSTVKHAQSAVARYGSPELKTLLESTGLGSHPELVRAFAKIGRSMAEDSIVNGSSNAAPSDPALRIYTTMSK